MEKLQCPSCASTHMNLRASALDLDAPSYLGMRFTTHGGEVSVQLHVLSMSKEEASRCNCVKKVPHRANVYVAKTLRDPNLFVAAHISPLLSSFCHSHQDAANSRVPSTPRKRHPEETASVHLHSPC